MKRLAIVAAVVGLIGMPGFAAAQPPASAPIYSWTGWYVGGNVGGSWGNAHTDLSGSGTSVSAGSFTNPPVTFADSQTKGLSGFIGGGQAGFNYQVNPKWMVGLETDLQGSAVRGSGAFSDLLSGSVCFVVNPGPPVHCNIAPTAFNGAAVTSYQAKIEWFGTLRGRAGVLLNNGLLLYGTGGLAFGQVSVSGNANISGSAGALPFGPNSNIFDQSRTSVGFVAGGGLEGRFSTWLPPNCTWKLEYLYLDLGSLNTSSSLNVGNPSGGLSSLVGPLATRTHFTDNIVRVGLNYQFH